MKVKVISQQGDRVGFEGLGISGEGAWKGMSAPVMGKQYGIELTLAAIWVWGATMGLGAPPPGSGAWQAQVEAEPSEGVVPLRIAGGICLVEVTGAPNLKVGDQIWLVPSNVELYPVAY